VADREVGQSILELLVSVGTSTLSEVYLETPPNYLVSQHLLSFVEHGRLHHSCGRVSVDHSLLGQYSPGSLLIPSFFERHRNAGKVLRQPMQFIG
jgi:hypothetical protein